ncbi:MAG: transglycosylase domain-containing protein [Bacteroidetes bacterium]|nr:transglycosylase domain-containing protein [Bacteroidota bacterium]
MVEKEKYNGFVLLCNKNKPLGVISSNSDKYAICNTELLPPKFKSYLVTIEDHRFYEHGAIDVKAISRALYQNIKSGKIVQGGSTLTQQLARNILKDNDRNIIRKIREVSLAFDLENKHTKDDILNLYFDKVFWGRRNYGLRVACLEYFSKEPEQLNTATFLRGPNYYLKNEEKFLKRMDLVSQILRRKDILSSRKILKIKKTPIQLTNNTLDIYRNDSIPFISKNINKKKHSIITTLDEYIQKEVIKFISTCKYPTSIIGIRNGDVICVGSSNGSDYPFNFKSNVGSTLKPFIYSFLRENGISENDIFQTANKVDWKIREVQQTKKETLTLKEALQLSNNNTFVNASYSIGIEKTLLFLSQVTNKPLNNFVPSSILGASNDGLTLYELTSSYEKFFSKNELTPVKHECLTILNQIAKEKFKNEITNMFLKTGTTNFNKERFAIAGYANTFFGFLRQGNEDDNYSKEGSFISNIFDFLKSISEKIYKWS